MTICNMSIGWLQDGSESPPMTISRDENVFQKFRGAADWKTLVSDDCSSMIRLSDGCLRLGSHGDLGDQSCYGR